MFQIHLYYNISKLIYSFIGRRDYRFVLLESFGSILFLLILFFFGEVFSIFFQSLTVFDKSLTAFLYPLFCGVIYVLLSLFSRLIIKANPEELAELKIESKIILPPSLATSLLQKKKTNIISIGIIDCSWLLIMGATYSMVLYCSKLNVVLEPILANRQSDYYKLYFDEVDFLFGKSIDMVLLLGSILAICMSIIWSGELWRKSDGESRKQYLSTTLASIKMVIAYFIIAISVLFWFSLPLFEKYSLLKEFIN